MIMGNLARTGEATVVRAGMAGMLILLVAQSVAQGQSRTPPPAEARSAAGKATAVSFETPRERAWAILREGLKDKNTDKRAKAVRALGLL